MGRQISVAIVPVAGAGRRLRPVTRVLPKALFPLVGPDGAVRPVADWIARQALAAGVHRVCFVTSAGQDWPLKAYFAEEPLLAGRIEFVPDVQPYGLGYAVWSARSAAGGEPVMVLLGDHLHLPADGPAAPARQVAEAFASTDAPAVVGVQVVGDEELPRVGVCAGESIAPDLYRCTALVEKPSPALAAERLVTPGLPEGCYLAHAGIYAFGPEIFDCLAPLVAARPEGAEVELTDAQRELLRRHPHNYLLRRVRGQTLDMGTPAGYVRTLAAVARG